MKIFIGADHRGFPLKEKLKTYLTAQGHDVADMGASELSPEDDYPDFALPVAQGVAGNADSRGILLCGSGMGMDVVANKVRGVRATVAYSRDAAVHARQNDDINIITLAADVLDEHAAFSIVEAFLSTAFSGEERHVRRLKKIAAIEGDIFRA